MKVEREIGKRLAAISPIRAIASVREISGSVYKKPFMTVGPAVGWVGETDARHKAALRAVLPPAVAANLGPALASVSIYVLMAAVLFWRPQGLFPARG